MWKKTKLVLILLLPIQYALLLIIRQFPQFVETYYSLGFYPISSKILRYIFGWIPFSVGDIFYAILVLLLIRWGYKNISKIKSNPIQLITNITAAISIVYFTFHLLWGLNYHRLPLHKALQLKNDYTTERLIVVTKRLIEKSNTLHRKLGYADSIKVELPYSKKQLLKKSIQGYQNLEKEYPNLAYSPKSIKKSSWSLALTYMGYSGYFNPLTNEAQVNNLIKTHRFPIVSCHEQAHQIGYAAENEANFIATLATLHNNDSYIVYTGYIFALRHCISEIARRNKEKYNSLLSTINFGILKNYKETNDFWREYKNPFESVSKVFWDQFLKANNQTKGIRSYSYMVALIVNYFEKN